jgi:hypothetical protein
MPISSTDWSLFRSLHKSLETPAKTIHKIRVDDLIFANLQFNSARLKNSIRSNQSHLRFKTTDLCLQYRYLEIVGTIWISAESSNFSCAQVKIFMRSVYKKYVFVREKSSSVSRFQRYSVEPAERTSFWERDWSVCWFIGHAGLGREVGRLGPYSQSPPKFATMQIYCLTAYSLLFTGYHTKDLRSCEDFVQLFLNWP